jgi:hypothetical protein
MSAPARDTSDGDRRPVGCGIRSVLRVLRSLRLRAVGPGGLRLRGRRVGAHAF